ncbi:MAG: MlaD family protein, partial [Gordonia sp. (in: high G+C Gram-positive bacteria)]
MRIDTGGRDPSLTAYIWRGAAFLAVAILVLVLLMMRYEGKFDSYTKITANLNDVGDGLIDGAEVRYNGFIVGAVKSVDAVGASSSDGVTTKKVAIDLAPDQAEGIPSNVKARTVPSNLFGVNSVELVRQDQVVETRLTDGATIGPDTSEPTIRLQDAQNELRTLLKAVPPEDL